MSTAGHQTESSQPKRFLQPCLLLLIAESPAHGYDLLDRLAQFGFERDPGGLYRSLRTMEREHLVTSEWQLSGTGPGRRHYELTEAGWTQLRSGIDGFLLLRQIVGSYVERYRVIEESRECVPAPPESAHSG